MHNLFGSILLNDLMGDLSITKLIGMHQQATFCIQQACLVWRIWQLCAWRVDAKPLEKFLGLDVISMLVCWVGKYLAITIYIGAQQTGMFY